MGNPGRLPLFWENSWLELMKNSINISKNVNLIFNTYRCLFLQTATENLLCCSISATMPSKRSQQDSVEMEKFWNLQHSKFVNHNGAKMVDAWNVNKLTEANEVGTNVNFGISIWNMEYGMRNMSVLIPFYNKYIKKRRIKRLKNIDLLSELRFYEELNVIKTNQAFKGYASSYKVELVEKKKSSSAVRNK